MNLVEANRKADFGNLLPTMDELKHLRPGNFIRLSLQNGTLFHAQVDEIRPNGIIKARSVDTCGPVKMGDDVYCERCHVYEIV